VAGDACHTDFLGGVGRRGCADGDVEIIAIVGRYYNSIMSGPTLQR